MSRTIDRRRFLLGMGGAMLALPMLEAFAPRKAAAAPGGPKRVVFMMHKHGRPLDDTKGPDPWSPAAAGPLPATISPALIDLAPIRDKIVTIKGVDNVVRHSSGADGGHGSGETTALTCRKPLGNEGDNQTATAESIDFTLGERLKAGPSMHSSIVFQGNRAGDFYLGGTFYGLDGTPPYLADSRPEVVAEQLFAGVNPSGPPPVPTMHDKMMGRRKSLLDGVAKEFLSLRGKLNEADRDRLDQHADFIQKLHDSVGTGTGTPTAGCAPPDPTNIPDYSGDNGRGQMDGITVPYQIDNLVQALACDITRVAALDFDNGGDPLFLTEFPGGNAELTNSNWHAMIHENGAPTDPEANTLKTAFRFFPKMFVQLVQKIEAAGLLDDTLIIWASEMGTGATHAYYDIPIVMAGMPSAFPKGQGRHIVMNRHTLGDLWAHVLRMVGGSDMTFGETGTLGSISSQIETYSGIDISASTPLHRGPIDF